MKTDYPAVKVRLPFARGRAILYEDYLAIEHMHPFGMSNEDSRTYYDEIRWVLRYQKRDWHRVVHAILWGFLVLIGALLALLPNEVIVQAIGLGLALSTGLAMIWSAYRFLAVPRTVAAILSPRGTVEIGTDWPISSNRRKDAAVFFDAFLAKLELVAEIPVPAPPAVEATPATGDAPAVPPPPSSVFDLNSAPPGGAPPEPGPAPGPTTPPTSP